VTANCNEGGDHVIVSFLIISTSPSEIVVGLDTVVDCCSCHDGWTQ
jgi:hypothetical protein